MEERRLYKPIGDWLIKEKDCQSNRCSDGYTFEPPITHADSKTAKKPDVVGVHYERADTKTPRFNFHFHLVEVKDGTDPQQIQNVMGEIESLRYYVEAGKLAADSVAYYVALPAVKVPQDLRNWAEENSVGVLVLETSDDPVIVREKPAPESVDRGIKRSEVVSNNDQQSPGRFKQSVRQTTVLKQIIHPDAFFDNLIRPEQEQLQAERDRKKAFDYIDNPDAQEAMYAVVSHLEDQDGIMIRPHSGRRPTLFVDTEQEEKSLQIRPQRRNFKILNRDGDTLFRIAANTEFEITQEDISNLPQLESYLQKSVL